MSDPRQTAQRWSIPEVEGPIVGGRREDPKQREQAERNAWLANHARGYEEGLAVGQGEIRARIEELDARLQRLGAALDMLAKPMEALDAEVEKQLVALTLAVAKQLLRRELKTDPGQIIAIIREAVGRLPISAREIRVHLHPEDAALVREKLATPGSERAWTVVEDPALSRGGCTIRTEASQVDARLESRLNAIVSNILGDERAATREAPADSEP